MEIFAHCALKCLIRGEKYFSTNIFFLSLCVRISIPTIAQERTESHKVRLYQYIILIRFWNIWFKRQKIFLNYSIEILRGSYNIAINEQFIFKFINNDSDRSSVPNLEKVFTFLLLFNMRVSDLSLESDQ